MIRVGKFKEKISETRGKVQENNNNKSQQKEREPVCEVAICKMCGRKIDFDSCSWDDDVGEGPYCRDCRAEIESCGCSD